MIGTHFYDLNHECSTVIKPEYDTEGRLISNKTVIDHLKRHMIAVENGRREKDSSIFDYEVFTLTNAKILELKEKFNRNIGTFIDGKHFKLNKSEYYFKFTTNIAISVDAGVKRLSESQKLFELVSLYERSAQQYPTLSLFINGIKIPDAEILVYMADSCTELLIPERLLMKDGNGRYIDLEVLVQKHIYTNTRYHTIFLESNPSKMLSFDISDEKFRHVNLNFKYKYIDGQITSEIESCKNIMVYANGYYRTPGMYQLSKQGNIVTINMNNSNFTTSDFIEVVFDSDVKVINNTFIEGDYSTNASMVRCCFNIPESLIDYKTNFLFGSLPKKNCYFFINSKRINPNKIKQVGRMNFVYESAESPYAPYNCTLIYTDKDDIDESRNYIYGDDYYLSNFYGLDKLTKCLNVLLNDDILKTTDSFVNPNLFDPSLDYLKIMTKDNKLYSKAYAEYINNLNKKYLDYNSLTTALIKEGGNYLIRDFMNLYSKDDIYDEVYKSNIASDYISYTFKTKKDEESETTKFTYTLDLNGVHIPFTKYTIVPMHQYNHIKIPVSLLSDGLNRIHIRESKYDSGSFDNLEYLSVKVDELKEMGDVSSDSEFIESINSSIERIEQEIENTRLRTDISDIEKGNIIDELNITLNTYKNAMIGLYKYSYTFNKFTTVLDLDDYICLNLVYDEEGSPGYGLYYGTGTNSGYIMNKNFLFSENADGTITLLLKEKPVDNIVIYSKRFSFKFQTTISKDLTDLSDMSITIKAGDALELPVIPIGSYTIYLNGERMYNGIDYVFRHPGNYDLITYTSLALKRKTKTGDVIEIYFDNVRNVSVGRSNDILSHSGTVWNKYGLIYFGNIKYPYSPRYIDLYVNGKYIYPDQIQILSDKLIRIDPEILNPMFDIFAETSFSVDLDKLGEFFEYEDTELEKIIKKLFVDYDFSTITNPSENSIANTIYESFDDDVDDWGKIPNNRRHEDSDIALEIVEDLVPKRYSLYECAYLLWLNSPKVKTLIKNGENVQQDIMNYFKFFVEENLVGERQDVPVSAQNTKTFNDIILSAKNYPIEHSERVQRYLKFAKGNNLGVKSAREKLTSHYSVSNVMYPRDFPRVISSRTRIAQTNRDLVIGGKPSSIYHNTTTHKDSE